MSGKQNSNTASAGAAAGAEMVDAFGQATDHGCSALQSGFEEWSKESQRWLDEMAAQSGDALNRLKDCKTPLDVLRVEQAWIAGRSKTYLESGLRVAQAFATVAQRLKPSTSKPDDA